jgi:hypothetical protein
MTNVSSQLSGGDMVAILMCLLLHMTESAIQESKDATKLHDFIEDNRGSGTPLVMDDLTALYDKCIATLGFPYIKCNNTFSRGYRAHDS